MSRITPAVAAFLFLSIFAQSATLQAELVSFEVIESGAFADGAPFGVTGPYTYLRGVARFEIDPEHELNRIIVDVENVPKNKRGKVEFEADVSILTPSDPSKGNRALLYGVNNRGRKNALGFFNEAQRTNAPRTLEHAGDGFLFRQGYTVVWCGWISELIPGDNKLLLRAPIATADGAPIRGITRHEIVANNEVASMPLSRRTGHGSFPPTPEGEAKAELTWRLRETDKRVPVPRGQWRLERLPMQTVEAGVPGTLSEIRLHLAGGFRPGSIYELVYETEGPPVQGLGFAAVRDLIAILKYGPDDRLFFHGSGRSPLEIDYAYGFGVSQSGRFLRNFLHLGFNVDESGRKVFDGLIPHVAGAGLGFFNFRFAQPNRHNGQHEDHLFTADRFPFTYGTSYNPFSGKVDAIQARTAAKNPALLPKVMHTQSAAEYWHRAGSLVHTDPLGRLDATVPENVRVYTFGGTQHGPAGWPPKFSGAQNLRNPGDYKPFLRALLVALDAWARSGTAPPPSVYPRIDNETLVSWDQASTGFPALPGVRYPRVIQAPHELFFGQQIEDGIITVTPPRKRGDFVVLVPKSDADGNNLGTLLPPAVAVPLATYTGWNLRNHGRGAEDMLESLAGSFFPFPKTKAERETSGDSRTSIEERYTSFKAYRDAFKKECDRLVNDRYLLRKDADRLVDDLATKYSSIFPTSWNTR